MPELLQPEREEPLYQPNETEQKVISAVWDKWKSAEEQRNGSYRFFGDRSFVEYVNDSVDRFNGYIEPRTDPAGDWGAKVFNNATRNKSVAIIANITAERVRAEFFPQNQDSEDDYRAAQLVKQVEDYTYYKNKDDQQQFYTVLEAVTKGTSIGYEGYKLDKRTVFEIEDYDAETGEVKSRKKEITDWDDVFGDLIPLFDFYPGNIWERDLQRQPFVVWRTVLDFDLFKSEFEKYPKAKWVTAKSQPMGDVQDDRSKISASTNDNVTAYVSDDIGEGKVEVIRYFNKWTDEFHILANGVLLTKTKSPFPWDHKMYPFWKTVFEPIAVNFFYGKSLPDKLRSNQDVLNTLYRMLLDQSFLSINPPMITTGIEGIKDERLYPGKRLVVDDAANTKALEIPAPQQAHFNVIKMVEENLKRDSIDDPLSGVSGSRVSAFEVGVAKESAQKLLSLFLRCLEWGVRDKTELRVKNILQFYRMPLYKQLAENEMEQYRRVVIDNVNLVDGTKGRQVIQMLPSEDQLPTQGQITGAELYYLAKGTNVAFSFLTADLLKNLDLKIKIIPNSSLKMSEALQRALELDYQEKAALLYPDKLNRDEGWREFNESFDKDPQKMTNMNGGGASPLGSAQPATMGSNPAQPFPPPSIPGIGGSRSGPSGQSPNSAAAAGVPTPNTTQNSARNLAVQ